MFFCQAGRRWAFDNIVIDNLLFLMYNTQKYAKGVVKTITIKYIKAPERLKLAIACLFPLILVIAVEAGQYQSLLKVFDFASGNIGVFLFDIFLVSIFFIMLSALVRHIWISSAICVVPFYTFACVEYFKYNVSGSHFFISDLAMTKNVTDVATFANLSFNVPLFIAAVILLAYVALIFFLNIKVPFAPPIRYAASLGALFAAVILLVTPYFNIVCEAVGVDDTVTKNNFQDNERFENNFLIANLAVSVNHLVNSKPERPREYNEQTVDAIIENIIDDNGANGVNVITIMSESFADFRDFLSIYDALDNIPEGTYDKLDEIYAESTVGTCVVPTFGGGTVKSEIELIFGLPMEAQGNPAIPLSVFTKGDEYSAIPALYRANGYATAYLHPFSPEFYERVDYYDHFGFDSLMFEEDMSCYLSDELLRLKRSEGIETAGYYNNFISDAAVFSDALERMKYTDEADYIHITTMQNHMPYDDGIQEEKKYFAGIQSSAQAMYDFISELKSFGEPVILLFVGDHFPFFSEDNNIYNRCGIDANNCDTLYEQKYFIWNNAGIKFESEPLISSFYLPCIIAEKAGVSDSFVRAILSQKEICPVYSPVIASEGTEVLRILAYDKISGNQFSD